MNRADATRWNSHFFPLGIAFLLTGLTGLLQTLNWVAAEPDWRCWSLLGVAAGVFLAVEAGGMSRTPEEKLVWIIGAWVSAGILQVGGLGFVQLYPLLMAFLGFGLLFGYVRRRGLRS